MTGFGRGEATTSDVSVVVELRSVNNRYLDVQVRAPREYMAFEPQIHNTLKDEFKRGRIEAYVRRQPVRTRAVVTGDRELFQAYLGAIDELVGQTGTRDSAVSWVLTQPGVLLVATEDVDVLSESDVLGTALDAAIASLRQMRTVEGKALEDDLDQHLMKMLDEIAAIESAVGDLHLRLRGKLEVKIKKLLGDRHEPWRVIQEAAILAERADVSEELARLRSHAAQFKDALGRDEPVGRRLDFLLQEMNREVNTVGSKAAEHPVSHRVVELKSILERMREQAANVE